MQQDDRSNPRSDHSRPNQQVPPVWLRFDATSAARLPKAGGAWVAELKFPLKPVDAFWEGPIWLNGCTAERMTKRSILQPDDKPSSRTPSSSLAYRYSPRFERVV